MPAITRRVGLEQDSFPLTQTLSEEMERHRPRWRTLGLPPLATSVR